MNNFLNSLNNRERNLVLATLLMIVTLILFFIFTNTIQSLNFSSKKLEKAKSDYEYVVLKAQQLSNSFINQSNDPAEIKSFIDNSIDLDIKNLEVDNIDNYLCDKKIYIDEKKFKNMKVDELRVLANKNNIVSTQKKSILVEELCKIYNMYN